jgi:hypothetical protein
MRLGVVSSLPFVMAPALRVRATGGKVAPSRCHGVRICFCFEDAAMRSS